jgi:hypothetical protein
MAEHDLGEDAIGFLPLPPAVKDHLYELTWPGRLEPSESIVMEVSWVGEREVILKEVNRSGDEGKVILFDLREVRWIFFIFLCFYLSGRFLSLLFFFVGAVHRAPFFSFFTVTRWRRQRRRESLSFVAILLFFRLPCVLHFVFLC